MLKVLEKNRWKYRRCTQRVTYRTIDVLDAVAARQLRAEEISEGIVGGGGYEVVGGDRPFRRTSVTNNASSSECSTPSSSRLDDNGKLLGRFVDQSPNTKPMCLRAKRP